MNNRTKKVYIVVVESNLPGEYMLYVGEAYNKKEEAITDIGCLAYDTTHQIDRGDFYPEYFEEYSEENTPTSWKITSNRDDSFYVEAWIEERELEINNGKAVAGIITIIFGLFLIAIAIGLFQSTINAKDDDIIFYIFGIIFSGFGGFCLLLAGIADYNKAIKQNKK